MRALQQLPNSLLTSVGQNQCRPAKSADTKDGEAERGVVGSVDLGNRVRSTSSKTTKCTVRMRRTRRRRICLGQGVDWVSLAGSLALANTRRNADADWLRRADARQLWCITAGSPLLWAAGRGSDGCFQTPVGAASFQTNNARRLCPEPLRQVNPPSSKSELMSWPRHAPEADSIMSDRNGLVGHWILRFILPDCEQGPFLTRLETFAGTPKYVLAAYETPAFFFPPGEV
jgi:hypothetical protein